MAMSKSFVERVRSISVKGEALAAVLHDVTLLRPHILTQIGNRRIL